jgi:hypothetical protein
MKVSIIKKGSNDKGHWAFVNFEESGFICTGFLRPATQEVMDKLVEGEEFDVPRGAIKQ